MDAVRDNEPVQLNSARKLKGDRLVRPSFRVRLVSNQAPVTPSCRLFGRGGDLDRAAVVGLGSKSLFISSDPRSTCSLTCAATERRSKI